MVAGASRPSATNRRSRAKHAKADALYLIETPAGKVRHWNRFKPCILVMQRNLTDNYL
jgi:hypothetical protein